MLSPKTQYNLVNAKSYFEEHLCVGDYYTEKESVRGEWIGQATGMLGLSGVVSQKEFRALCDNQHPSSGKRLTQRLKTNRREPDRQVANRRVFYDFTFSPPKSVSIAALLAEDTRIVLAHRDAVRAAITELEQFAATRVRVNDANSDRRTGNIVAALFEHETSRSLDPHLHTHCIIFNVTKDQSENRWKALQTYDMLSAQKFAENVYYHELGRALRGFGYTIINSARGDFELAEVPASLRERFSKRHQEIDKRTRELLEQNPSKSGNIAAIRENIAHKERARKVEVPGRLRERWLEQLSLAEREALAIPVLSTVQNREGTVQEALSWAEEHLFERRSVVKEHELWRNALEFGRGANFSVAEVKAETARRDYIRADGGKVSTRDVLSREWQIVEMAREGNCRHTCLVPTGLRTGNDLAPDQQHAFERILSSSDFVTVFRGGAGTGKSYVLRRVQKALHHAGHPTVVLAPQRQQVLDLARDGLEHGQTVSEFVQRSVPQNGAVVIVDEAGQIGAKQLLAVLQLVQAAGGRVILSGDTRQHGPVEVSDSLRAIELYSGLVPAELSDIRRQDPARGQNDCRTRIYCSLSPSCRTRGQGQCSFIISNLG